ncbi:hypothetical protein QTP88_004924 [Uroleucon formosanum]
MTSQRRSRRPNKNNNDSSGFCDGDAAIILYHTHNDTTFGFNTRRSQRRIRRRPDDDDAALTCPVVRGLVILCDSDIIICAGATATTTTTTSTATTKTTSEHVDSALQTACCGGVAGGHPYRRKGKRLRSTLPRGYGRLAMHLSTFVSAALRDARQRPLCAFLYNTRAVRAVFVASSSCAPPRLPVLINPEACGVLEIISYFLVVFEFGVSGPYSSCRGTTKNLPVPQDYLAQWISANTSCSGHIGAHAVNDW